MEYDFLHSKRLFKNHFNHGEATLGDLWEKFIREAEVASYELQGQIPKEAQPMFDTIYDVVREVGTTMGEDVDDFKFDYIEYYRICNFMRYDEKPNSPSSDWPSYIYSETSYSTDDEEYKNFSFKDFLAIRLPFKNIDEDSSTILVGIKDGELEIVPKVPNHIKSVSGEYRRCGREDYETIKSPYTSHYSTPKYINETIKKLKNNEKFKETLPSYIELHESLEKEKKELIEDFRSFLNRYTIKLDNGFDINMKFDENFYNTSFSIYDSDREILTIPHCRKNTYKFITETGAFNKNKVPYPLMHYDTFLVYKPSEESAKQFSIKSVLEIFNKENDPIFKKVKDIKKHIKEITPIHESNPSQTMFIGREGNVNYPFVSDKELNSGITYLPPSKVLNEFFNGDDGIEDTLQGLKEVVALEEKSPAKEEKGKNV